MSLKEQRSNDDLGINDDLGLTFEAVWIVRDMSNGHLITTSGRLNTNTLQDTIDQTTIDFPDRMADYTFSLDGTIQAILHVDDTFDFV